MASFSKKVVANADDGYQYGTTLVADGTEINLGKYSASYYRGFFRFTNVTIPAGASITSAVIKLRASSDFAGGTALMRISCEDEDSAAQISSSSDCLARVLTTAYADWSISTWSTGTEYSTPDFKDALQEVIDRGGWASGNSVQVHIVDNGTSNQIKRAAALENTSYAEAELFVEYASITEVESADTAGTNDSVDAFSLSDSLSDAAGVSDSVDAYNTDEVMAEGIGSSDAADSTREVSGDLADGSGVADFTDAGLEKDVQTVDACGISDLSDGFNFSAWLRLNRDRSVIRYYCTLTGANDSLSDLSIPISSFQARKRTGESTYLSVVVPGMALADSIADRLNGELVIDMAYLIDGAESLREEILRVDLEQINPSIGPRNRSITLVGHKTVTYDARAASIQGANYKYENDGLLGFRFPQADPYLNPGDALTVLDTDDVFTVDYITYAISAKGAKFMEVREG